VAAFEYEKFKETEGIEVNDYSTSVSRIYTRSSLISCVRPLLLYVQIDPNGAKFKSRENSEAFVTTLATKCLEHKINGIVLTADDNPKTEDTLTNTEIISLIKGVDKDNSLTFICNGGNTV